MVEDDEINLAEYWDILVDNRWLILGVLVLALAAGIAYAVVARPVYQTNLLIQVEDSAGSAKSFLGEASSLFDVKTPAAAEIEIIRSRLIVGQAVDNTALHIDARPRYVPFIGNWMARRAKTLSDPGFLGLGGYVSGTERIGIETFKVPSAFEGERFRVTSQGAGAYTLSHPEISPTTGRVGVPLVLNTPEGPINLTISQLLGKAGADFNLRHRSRLDAIEHLQAQLKLAEKGRQSGVIDVSMQSTDPVQLTVVLNEIGRQYVRQNIERKAAEAQKTLSFLETQLPQFKKQLDAAEDAYNKYRNQQGTVALDEEAKVILNRSADLQSKLLEAQQKRRENEARFTAEHPIVRTIDAQIGAFSREIASLNARVKTMPTVQQDAIRLERDVKVNNELYQSLRNNALQLQLVREGKVGNVRLIDEAALPEDPVKPKPSIVVALAGVLGLLGGIMVALGRNALFRGVKNPQEIEAHTGLSVYSTIPLSDGQYGLARKVREKAKGVHLLALTQPHDPAIESLRSLRTALQFGMLEAPNNRIIITGPTPGVGKSFVAANFAALMAAAGKRVLLIDADLRKGYLNQYFGLPRADGLSELVAGSISASQAVRRQVLPNLDFLPTGQIPPNPAELMQSSAMAQVLQATSPHYDLVIIDTPPVLVAADTAAVAPHVGTLLMVARAEQTHLGELHESGKRLAQSGKAVTGVLFNAMDLTRRHYGSYGYKYGRYRYRNYGYKSTS
ncbi:polysaccharide biosynthesis tyrosine autokinase [Caenimonas sedimenti]|uniref:Putative tyrosine-protein kinase EpsB n=2 Tax=Caenimonas sedimenti TaxID=2596921 RepID=A0A562ZVA4_9BURK|nr:polysaccharide biosynthesis tyrosine autokinase [Caenimonas sedimenti]TWO72529.1 polysaccharide biosynthesis tyrosine autokinase [Caenimonas sedimenti]